MQSVAIFLKPVFSDTKVVLIASFTFGKILVTCYIPKLEKGKQIKCNPNMRDLQEVGGKFTFFLTAG